MKERSPFGDGKVMKRLLIALALAVVIPACHRSSPPPAPAMTEVLIQATNFDAMDYNLSIASLDAAGFWHEGPLFSIYGDPSVGPTMDFIIVGLADPLATTVIRLRDSSGALWDSYPLVVPPGSDFVEFRFEVENGYLYLMP